MWIVWLEKKFLKHSESSWGSLLFSHCPSYICRNNAESLVEDIVARNQKEN
jgi:hypothetical protein